MELGGVCLPAFFLSPKGAINMENFPTWAEFLAYLQGPGISVVVGVLLSFLIEYWTGYQNLEAKWKRLIFGGLSLFVPLLGATLSCASGLAAWANFTGHWWIALQAGGLAFFSGQMAHMRKLTR
jgi:hypothetical protein